MEGLSAKVFRTYNASFTLQRLLNEEDVDPIKSVEQKVLLYNNCNREVAKLCNHKKAVAKNFEEQHQKLVDDLEKHKGKLKQLTELNKKFKTKGDKT